MTNDSITLVPRYALAVGTAIALGLVGAQPALAQFRSALDVSTRSARPGLRGKERIVAENHVPPSTRGRVRKQTARVQAKRDSRPK